MDDQTPTESAWARGLRDAHADFRGHPVWHGLVFTLITALVTHRVDPDSALGVIATVLAGYAIAYLIWVIGSTLRGLRAQRDEARQAAAERAKSVADLQSALTASAAERDELGRQFQRAVWLHRAEGHLCRAWCAVHRLRAENYVREDDPLRQASRGLERPLGSAWNAISRATWDLPDLAAELEKRTPDSGDFLADREAEINRLMTLVRQWSQLGSPATPKLAHWQEPEEI